MSNDTTETPRTDARMDWIKNDIRYKAPEQIVECHIGYIQMLSGDCAELERENAALRRKLEKMREDYHELIMTVGNKYPDETRHQTALRYIQNAENRSNGPDSCAIAETKQK